MSYFQRHLDDLVGYVPGEQPRRTDLVKLNTNESPYPPSERVVEAIERAARGPLNRYPDPLARDFTQAAGEVLGIDPNWIVAVNGSDEALTLLTRACCGTGDAIAAPAPSYLLYRILANIQGCRFIE